MFKTTRAVKGERPRGAREIARVALSALRQELSGDDGRPVEVVRYSVRKQTCYAAVRHGHDPAVAWVVSVSVPDGSGAVVEGVCEDESPGKESCPRCVLGALGPARTPEARSWREACLDAALSRARRAEA